MKYLLSLTLILCGATLLSGQQFVIDSLTKLLITETNPIRKADLHLGLSRAINFVNSQSEEVKNNADIAFNLSQKHGYQEGKAVALILQAQWNFFRDGDSDILYEAAKKAIAIAQVIPSKSVEVFAQYHLAEYYIYDKNDYKTGINILNKTIETADESVADKNIGNCYKVLGLAYETNGQYSLALSQFEKALTYYNRIKTHPYIDPKLGRSSATEADFGIINKAQVQLYIGRVYMAIGEPKKSIEYLTIAKNIYEETETVLEVRYALEALGIAYQTFGKGEQAIEAYQQAAIIYEEIESEFDLGYLFLKLGQIFTLQKDYIVAESYLSKSLDIGIRRADTILLGFAYDDFGKFFRAQEKFDQALAHMKEREKISIALKE